MATKPGGRTKQPAFKYNVHADELTSRCTKMLKKITWPLLLTWSRIFLVPVFVAVYYLPDYVMPMPVKNNVAIDEIVAEFIPKLFTSMQFSKNLIISVMTVCVLNVNYFSDYILPEFLDLSTKTTIKKIPALCGELIFKLKNVF